MAIALGDAQEVKIWVKKLMMLAQAKNIYLPMVGTGPEWIIERRTDLTPEQVKNASEGKGGRIGFDIVENLLQPGIGGDVLIYQKEERPVFKHEEAVIGLLKFAASVYKLEKQLTIHNLPKTALKLITNRFYARKYEFMRNEFRGVNFQVGGASSDNVDDDDQDTSWPDAAGQYEANTNFVLPNSGYDSINDLNDADRFSTYQIDRCVDAALLGSGYNAMTGVTPTNKKMEPGMIRGLDSPAFIFEIHRKQYRDLLDDERYQKALKAFQGMGYKSPWISGEVVPWEGHRIIVSEDVPTTTNTGGITYAKSCMYARQAAVYPTVEEEDVVRKDLGYPGEADGVCIMGIFGFHKVQFTFTSPGSAVDFALIRCDSAIAA